MSAINSVLSSKSLQPKIVIIRRRPNQGFGFTLRHFIAYPPEEDNSWSLVNNGGSPHPPKAMETIFIKEVQPNGPAYHANLHTGDRVLMVNHVAIAGIAYGTIVSMIKQTSTVLTLHVVPKECDVLQMHYTNIAHTPESNRALSAIPIPLVKYQMCNTNSSASSTTFCHQDISAKSFILHGTTEIKKENACSGVKQSINSIEAPTTSFEFSNVSESIQNYPTQNTLVITNDTCCTSSKSENLTVLTTNQYLSPNCSSPTIGNNDLMLRLRESIKQKEAFLKSPLPRSNQQLQQGQVFFSNTPPSGSPQLSMASPASSCYIPGSRSRNNEQNKVSLSDSCTNKLQCTQTNNFRDLITNSCDMNKLYCRNQNDNYVGNVCGNWNKGCNHCIKTSPNSQIHDMSGPACHSAELGYMELIQDTGVTNKVFERKLVSHLARGFDPFKPLSINTSSNDPRTSASANIPAKKVVYESLQHHPLHQSQHNQLRYPQHQKNSMHKSCNDEGISQHHMKNLMSLNSEYFYSNSPLSEKTNQPDNDDLSNISNLKVMRRYTPSSSSFEDNKPMRRISYLRATNNEADFIQTDSAALTNLSKTSANTFIEIEDTQSAEKSSEPIYDVVACGHEFVETAAGIEEIKLTKENDSLLKSDGRKKFTDHLKNISYIETLFSNGKDDVKDTEQDIDLEVFETEMEMKCSALYGKRISDFRSWRQVKMAIKGEMLKIYPIRVNKIENSVLEFNITCFKIIDESTDKKKYMFRMESKVGHGGALATDVNIDDKSDKLRLSGNTEDAVDIATQPHTDMLFKTKNAADMKRIFGFLQWKNSLIFNEHDDESGKQLAEPQKIPATTSVPTVIYCDDTLQPIQNERVTPQDGNFRGDLRNCDSMSPIMKTRKSASQKHIPEKDLGSPKSKNWKDLLFRRGGSTSHNADVSPMNLTSASKTTGSIGVPLKNCPMSKTNAYVPHILDVCTTIVETKGLGIVGIYRIPGNKAAISELSEQVNKHDFCWDLCNTDVRWEDVNVVSSLLKLFIRSLPDALLPTSFYTLFIEADKKIGLERLKDLKELLESLPRHSYETMKHLIRHLHRVSKNCEINLMEPKNLAIIFGPSIIRTPNDTLEIAVKDMKHQCRIVELLVTQYAYFFENGEMPEIGKVCGNNLISCIPGSSNTSTTCYQEDQTKMLLHNVSKIERFAEREASRASRFIPQLRRRTQSKRGTASSDTYSGESVLSLDSMKSPIQNNSYGKSQTIDLSRNSKTTQYVKVSTSKKKERIGFLETRTHLRKTSLDDKDSGTTTGIKSFNKERDQRNSVDVSILLTDEESSNSRLSDTGSMSLTTITDTLDSKLRSLRSGSESNDENDSPEFYKNRRHTVGEPLHLQSENIPFADESPERYIQNVKQLENERKFTISSIKLREPIEKDINERTLGISNLNSYRNAKLLHSSSLTTTSTLSSSNKSSTVTTSIPLTDSKGSTHTSKNLRFSSSIHEQCCSEADSEGSTTSNPKESLITTSNSFIPDKYNKKRREHKLFRSASFNCRNNSSRYSTPINPRNATSMVISALTKDEKTDMNLTKKRQIQNKQNRSIKRRHTVGGPHDYSSDKLINSCSYCNKKTSATANILRRLPVPNTKFNIVNNNSTQSDVNTGNGNDHVLEVGIRIKNINRNRFSNI